MAISLSNLQSINIRGTNRAVLDRVARVVSNQPEPLIEARPEAVGTPRGPLHALTHFNDFLSATSPPAGNRLEEMRYYDYLEREISDARGALTAFTTMATTGNLAGGGSDTFRVKMTGDEDAYPEPLRERLHLIEQLMKHNAFWITRGTTKYGSFTPQIIIGRKPDGRRGVVTFKPLQPGTIYRNVNRDGTSDRDAYWRQQIPGKSQSTTIPQWMLPHFALWTNVVNATETLLYGESILKGFGGIGLKVHSMFDALVVSRITRGGSRYKWIHDVTDLIKSKTGTDTDITTAIIKRMEKWAKHIDRQSVSDEIGKTNFGRIKPPEQDFHLPGADGFKWDVELLPGDPNVRAVADLELAFKLYFGALGVPPEYLGHERSQGGRSNLSQIDIQFARATRFIQMSIAAGFEHVVHVDMAFGDYDPERYPIEVVPPKIGARDDLLQAQIRGLQSQVILRLAQAGIDISANPRWVLQTFLNMSEELEALTDEQLQELFPKKEGTPPELDEEEVDRISADLSARNGELMDEVRNNLRLIAMMNDTSGIPHRYGHPQPGEINWMVKKGS